MGLSEWFRDFNRNLQISNRESIQTRYARLTKRLNLEYWTTQSHTTHSLYVGSYGRGTAINGLSDVDMLFELPYSVYAQYNSHAGNGQSALLQAVRNAITKTYSHTKIGGDGQVVSVPFTDGITFEVLPAFTNRDGSFTFPNANAGGSWKTTNPRPEGKAIKARDETCKGNLVRLCRMTRAWKGKWDVPIGGLLIDTLAYQFMEDYKYRAESYIYYDWLCRDFFNWMAEQSPDQVYWRAPGSYQYVYGKGLFQYKARRCHNIAVKAIANEMAEPKRESSAKQQWREIFGTRFPS